MKAAALVPLVVLIVCPAIASTPIAIPVERTTRSIGFPAAASDGESFFGIWEDELQDTTGAIFDAGGHSEGEFPVVATWQSDDYPATVWNGSEFITLVWAGALGVFAVGVTPGGDVRGISIPLETHFAEPPSLAWNGSRYAYAVHDAYHGLSLHLLDSSVRLMKSVPLAAAGTVRRAHMATDGSRFLLVWNEISGEEMTIVAQLIDEEGDTVSPRVTLDRKARLDRFFSLEPAVSWNGSGYLVVWTDDSIKAAVISADGVAGPVTTVVQASGARFAAVGWDGYAHFVTWSERTGNLMPGGAYEERVAAALVTSEGGWIESIPIPISGAANRPAITSNGDVLFVMWPGGDHFVIRSTGEPRLRRAEWLPASYQTQWAPAIAYGEHTLLGAWQEDGRIYAGRLSKDGRPLDGSGIELSSALGEPSIHWNSGTYLVTRHGGSLDASRITEEGVLLDATPHRFASVYGLPATAAGPNEFRLVAAKSIAPWQTVLITASLPVAGEATPEAQPLFDASSDQVAYALFWNGAGYTLLWAEMMSPPCWSAHCLAPEYQLRATTLSQQGQPISTRVIGMNIHVHAAVVTRDNHIAVLYRGGGLRLMKLTMTGDPLTSVPILPASWNVGRGGAMFETSDGFVTLYAGDVVWLDSDGDVQRSTEGPAFFNSLTSDGRRLWVTYGVPWHPRPKAHDRVIFRAWVDELLSRRRVAGYRRDGSR